MSDDDAIGFVRKHPRIGEKVQRSALIEDGVRGIVDDRSVVERMAAPGRLLKVRHLFLFADPKTQHKPGGWRKDLLNFMGRVEDKGAIIKDVDLQLTSEKPSHRSAMLLQAMEQLSSNGRTVHLHKKRSGRRELIFTPEVEAAVEKIWLNVRDYPNEDDAAKAIKKVHKDYTRYRARRKYKTRVKRQS